MKIEEQLSRILVEAHPAEAAAILERLPTPDAAAALERLPPAIAAPALARQVPAAGAACLAALPERVGAELLEALPFDVAARMLTAIDPSDRQALLARLPRRTAEALQRQLRYPPGTAGALMDPRVAALQKDLTVTEARRRVRRWADHVLYYLYVVDAAQRLVGVLNLRELMIAESGSALDAVMHREVAHLSVHAGLEAILRHPGWHQHHALPVTDAGGALVGVLRYETLRQLESDRHAAGEPKVVELGIALAEVYWTGAFFLLRELTTLLEDSHGEA